MSLEIGQKAPAFNRKDADDNEISLGQFAGKQNVLLLFYPFDFSGVCSTQLPRFNAALDGFKSRDTQVLAVSRDSKFSHKAFCESIGGLDYPVLSDMDQSMASAYGVALKGGFNNRAQFLIDKEGVVRWSNVEASPGDDNSDPQIVFQALDSL